MYYLNPFVVTILYLVEASALQTVRKRSLGSGWISDLDTAISGAQRSLGVIYHRYQMNEQIGHDFIQSSLNMDSKSFELVKFQLAKKIVSENPTYLAVFGGSSVTAGHDNRFNESYPEVFARKLAPVFKALGFKFDVHNIAQGANQCYPSNACYETMGGFNPDFVGWEQSFNCGHEGSMFELTARWALWSSNKALIFYQSSGSSNPGASCPPSKYNPPYTDEKWTPGSVGIDQPFTAAWTDVKKLKDDTIKSFEQKGPAADRFSGPALAYLKNGAPLPVAGTAFPDPSMWLKCDSLNFFGELEGSRFGKGKGAAHHPTTASHLFRGEAVAYSLLLPLMDALYMVQSDVKAGASDKSALFKKYSDTYETLYTLKKMPDPIHCESWMCLKKPVCLTDYHPHYAPNMSLSSNLVGTTKWEYSDGGKDPSSLPDVNHIELRPGYSAVRGPRSGSIHFRIEVPPQGASVVVLGYHFTGATYPSEYYIELNVADGRLQSYQPDEEKWLVWASTKKTKETGVLQNVPGGKHVLSVVSKLNEKMEKAGISHIMIHPNDD